MVFTLFACGPATTPGEEVGEEVGEGSLFADDKFEAVVRERLMEAGILDKPTDIISISDLEALTDYLPLENKMFSDITGLEYCVNVTRLNLTRNVITDISLLASLTKLTYLHLGNNRDLSDLSPLASLTNLTELFLGDNKITDVSPLASLTKLTWLTLESNQITDISPLTSLTNLTKLNLSANDLIDFSPLLSFPNLTRVTLWGSPHTAESDDVVAQLEAAGVTVKY